MLNNIFCKFGRKVDMEALFNKGELYLQTLETFRRLEDKERGDKYEGAVKMRSDENGKMTLTNKETGESIDLDITESKLIERHSGISGLHIYCVYCLVFEDHEGKRLGMNFGDEIINGFGDHVVVILDTHSFMKRVKAAVEGLGFKLMSGRVEYLEFCDYSGEIGPYRKEQRFSHQKEFRIVVMGEGRPEGPLKFSIGSLEDIALVGQAAEIRNLKVEIKDI